LNSYVEFIFFLKLKRTQTSMWR